MDILLTFVPLLFLLAVVAGIVFLVLIILRKNTGETDRMLQQLMEKNKELEATVERLSQQLNARGGQ